MLSLKNFSVGIESKEILKNINFEFEKGKIYAVMGPNGSGKSTLAYSIMGHPLYKIKEGSEMKLNGENIADLEVNVRAEKGIFLSFQSPLSLSGVRVYQLLQMALSGKMSPLEIRQKAKKVAAELKINEELLSRSINDGASGGEKKKMEVLQAAVLDKQLLIFDEVDTGVDVDALKIISQYLKKHQEDKTYIIITHYNRILHYLKPDKVLVIADGVLKKVGDYTLAEEIEKNGYEKVIA
ncbi:MAG: Fe-S cluster assembly ATPase SufC [Patescibacteria group bacterium]